MTTAIETLDQTMTETSPIDAVHAHSAVVEASRAQRAVVEELKSLRRRRAELVAEHAGLHARAAESASRRREPRDIADRVVAIEQALRNLASSERVLESYKVTADADVAAALKQARAEELIVLEQSARDIVARLIPAVEMISALNQELNAVRARAGFQGTWPMPFGVASPIPADRWLTSARIFAARRHGLR
jgi:hypothetical protein